jgi:UDP-glucose 4-epimerase
MNGTSRTSVLLAGGAGYVGIHVAVSLVEAGYNVVIADNFANSFSSSIDRAGEITGCPLPFVRCDVRDGVDLDRVFARHDIAAVINFAGLKCAPQSVAEPLVYHEVNLAVVLALLAAMRRHGCRRLIFSSSAALYGSSEVPVQEDTPAHPVSPYAWTKLAGERIISDIAAADPAFRAVSLRYFNPVGAHPSGRLGEMSRTPPTSLFPLLTQAVESGEALPVYGLDWPTRDGSCVRDFIHICDIADGHVAAVDALMDDRMVPGHETLNLGSGEGVTVLEAIDAFARVTGRPVRWYRAPRRPGDIGFSVADATRARDRLGWKTRRGIDEMCGDALRWHRAVEAGTETVRMAAHAGMAR